MQIVCYTFNFEKAYIYEKTPYTVIITIFIFACIFKALPPESIFRSKQYETCRNCDRHDRVHYIFTI